MNADAEISNAHSGDHSKIIQGEPRRSVIFGTTHWSVVLAAADHQSPGASRALERLCQTYWYPLYAYIRRRGYSGHDAEDLTQGFFAQLLERRGFENVSPAQGKFRSFLLASLNYFISDQYDRASAQKRGGGERPISFQAQTAEERFRLEPVDLASPDKLFERRWALTLLDQVMGRLREEFGAKGKSVQFERLSAYVVGNVNKGAFGEAARELNRSEHAISKMVQRMRQRFYVLFRDEIANTVATPADVDEELRYLCGVMAGVGL